MSTMTMDGPGLRPGLGAASPRSHSFVHARVMRGMSQPVVVGLPENP